MVAKTFFSLYTYILPQLWLHTPKIFRPEFCNPTCFFSVTTFCKFPNFLAFRLCSECSVYDYIFSQNLAFISFLLASSHSYVSHMQVSHIVALDFLWSAFNSYMRSSAFKFVFDAAHYNLWY